MEKFVRIPFEVLEDKNLQPTTKLLFGLILSLCNQNGYCWANNSYFIKTLSVSKITIIRSMKELVNKKLISYDKNNEENKRTIKILIPQGGYQNDTKWYQNDTLWYQKDTHNNIYNNNLYICDENEKVEKKKVKKKTFIKPTVEEIKKYCEERNNGIDAEYFFEYYEARDWLVKNKPMISWKASVITWEKNNRKQSSKSTVVQEKPKTPECVSEEDWEEIIRRAGLV